MRTFLNWPSSIIHHETVFSLRSSFGPNCASLLPASSALKPSLFEVKARSASATLRLCQWRSSIPVTRPYPDSADPMLPMMHLNHDTGQQPKVVLRGLAPARCPGNYLIGAAGRCREFEGVPQFSPFLSPKIGGQGVERKHEDNAGGFRFALPILPAG